MDTLTPLFPFGWHLHRLVGLVIGSGMALRLVLTGLVGGLNNVFSLRVKP